MNLGSVTGAREEVGRRAEQAALDALRNGGLKLLERNFRCRYGEIDLVMEDGRTIVFVEVRFRRDGRFGGAASSIDARKRNKLIKAAAQFLADRRLQRPSRFDVAALSPETGTGFRLDWIRNAFQSE